MAARLDRLERSLENEITSRQEAGIPCKSGIPFKIKQNHTIFVVAVVGPIGHGLCCSSKVAHLIVRLPAGQHFL